MGLPIYQVDAFTGRPFAGNPAAVCLLDAPRRDAWMQAVAREMNLSETAFLLPHADRWNLRWFTPAVEVALCGHATLASAHVLWETGTLGASAPARFETRSGRLAARRDNPWIAMDFPSLSVTPADPPPGLIEALGIRPAAVWRNRFDYLVELEAADSLRAMEADFARLREIPVRGVIVTAPSDCPDYDFISRFFAPASGVDEDPVTGSAHCCLGPFWAKRLGKDEVVGYQASARGGTVRVKPAGDRVVLFGQAVTVLRGELMP